MITKKQQSYILEGVCMWAEGRIIYENGFVAAVNKKHRWFKPTMGDRLIFKRILEQHLPSLHREYDLSPVRVDPSGRMSCLLTGAEIIEFSYYLDYRDSDGRKI